MAQQVVTELVIDSDTSGADRFRQAMDSAGSSAESGTSSVQSMTLAIAGVGAATVAAIAGMRSFVDFVGNQTQALVDMSNHAELAGISVKEFQQTMFAAMSSGVGEKDFTAGLDRIASDLTDASRGATMFGKLMDANGISIKDANGKLVTTKQALSDIASLMQQATPQQQQAIAKIVGLSASWIPFLKQGSEAIEEQKQKAADLGIIIDDSTIAKAKEFNAQWHTAVATWDLQFKASMASILPLLIQLADLASKVIEGIGSISGSAIRLMTPVDQQTTTQLNDTINEVERLTEVMQKFGEQSFRATTLKGALGLPEASDLKQVYDYMTKITEQYDKMSSRIRVTPAQQPGVNLPSLDGGQKDALERAIESIDRHIAKMNADREAVGQNVGELEKLRTEALLYDAAQKAGLTNLEKYADKFDDLAQKAGDAALALEKAKVASNIEFASKTSGLSPDDVQIAQQLKGIYGNDIPAAMASTEAAQLRVINAQKQLKDGALEFTQNFVHGLMQGKSAMESLKDAAGQLAMKLADKALLDLFSGNFLQAGIEGIAAIGSYLFSKSGESKEDKELKEAKENFAKMADQVRSFNAAAKGFDLDPITQSIQSLVSSYNQLGEAAAKAHEWGALGQLQKTYNEGILRLVLEYRDGVPVLGEFSQKVKDARDQASTLAETMTNLGFSAADTAAIIDSGLTRTLQRLKDETENSLKSDINSNSGFGWLNDINASIAKFNDLAGKVDPDLLSKWFSSSLQKIVDDAQLSGDAFQNLITGIPQVAQYIHEYTAALDASGAAAEKANLQLRLLTATTDANTLAGALALFDAKAAQERQAAIASGSTNLALLDQVLAAERANIVKDFGQKAIDTEKQITDARLNQMRSIQQYLDNLRGGSSSTLSPQDRLASTQDAYQRQLKLAQGGDTNALSSITQYSQNVIDAARSFYGSAVPYQTIFSQIQSDLASLIANQGGALSGGISPPAGAAAGAGSGGGAPPPAANSNSAVDAINALRSEVASLKTALKDAVDNNTKAVVVAHTEENANLTAIKNASLEEVAATKFLGSAPKTAAA